MIDITLYLAAHTLGDAARVLSAMLESDDPVSQEDRLIANSITPFEHFAEASAEMAGMQQWVARIEDDALVSVEVYN